LDARERRADVGRRGAAGGGVLRERARVCERVLAPAAFKCPYLGVFRRVAAVLRRIPRVFNFAQRHDDRADGGEEESRRGGGMLSKYLFM
jgi:hypothetical protein